MAIFLASINFTDNAFYIYGVSLADVISVCGKWLLILTDMIHNPPLNKFVRLEPSTQ